MYGIGPIMSTAGEPNGSQRPRMLLAVIQRADVVVDNADDRLALQFRRHERRRRRGQESDGTADLLRRARHVVAVKADHLARLPAWPQQQPRGQERADRVQPELELGHDAEVAAAAAQAPEQIRILGLARGHPGQIDHHVRPAGMIPVGARVPLEDVQDALSWIISKIMRRVTTR